MIGGKMLLNGLVKKITQVAVFWGLPLTSFYHHYTENPYINLAFEEATSLEKWSNVFLAPSHYLFGARFIQGHDEQTFSIQQRFEYEELFYPKAVGSAIVLPFSYTIGICLKGLSMIDSDVNLRHQAYEQWLKNGQLVSNLDYYQSLGIKIIPEEKMELAECQNHLRREEDIKTLSEERVALKEIALVFQKYKIPFWMDCGTCLGAYRYGGIIPWDFDVDLSILRPDFLNAFKALQELDPSKYEVQDWSGRDRPGSYLKLYVKKTHALIDIYTFQIDEKNKTVHYLIGNENSIFLPEGWKMRERLYTKPSKIEDVFPLKLAKFDGLLLPVPNKTKEYLQLRYGENIGPVKIFNPKTNEYEKDLSHPYWQFQYAK
jgi:hypothetical protein